jgi:hypothetical protein
MMPVVMILAALGASFGLLLWGLRQRGMDLWIIPYLRQVAKRRSWQPGEPVHVLICLADHYEPNWNASGPEEAMARVQRWVREYPAQFGDLRDSDGRPPQHSFFYPMEEYDPAHLDALAQLCRDGYGEVEIHLHHDNDTAEALREKMLEYREVLAQRHGLLSRDRVTGELSYGFIHGNWALDNCRPDGHWCGVNNELDILRETGCYADFTLPSAPDRTQTRKINSLYYACDDPERPKSHDWGVDVGAAPAPDNSLLLIQGPLVLDWGRRKWGLVPRIENGCVQASQPPSMERLELWLKARVQVPARPDWVFVKLHTHGAHGQATDDLLLGEQLARFYRALAERAASDSNFHVHYVTAREMYNLVRAAEAGWTGSVAEARDYQLISNLFQEPAAPARESRTLACASGS